MSNREPGDDDDVTIARDPDFRDDDEDTDGGDEEGLVPLGMVLNSIETERARVLAEVTARDVVNARLKQHHYVEHAEAMVIGAVLSYGNGALVPCEDQGLTASDFYSEARQRIWSAIIAVHEAGHAVETLTVCDELQRIGALAAVGGFAAVAKLEAAVLTAASVPECVRMIIEKSKLRGVQAALLTGLEASRHGGNLAEIVDRVVGELASVDSRGHASPFVHVGDIMTSVMDALPINGGVVVGNSTGFPDLDNYSLLKPGDLWVVAARPSMGKTSLALDIARGVALHRSKPMSVLIVSLEVTREAATLKLVQGQSNIENLTTRRFISPADRGQLEQAAGAIANSPIWVVGGSGLPMSAIKAMIREEHRKMLRQGLPPLGLIVVDYLQLIAGEEDTEENRTTQMSGISRGCKGIAMETGATFCALSQLNRGVESRADKRPMMSDIRESGAVEQDADLIAFIYREEYYAKDRCPEDRLGIAEVIVAKNRNGPIGSIDLRFHKEVPRFESLAPPGEYA